MPDSVWEQLHNLKHVDHSFHEVSNDFVYPDSYQEIFDWDNTNEYQESIQMFISLSAVFGVVFIVLVSCFACCCNYVRASEMEQDMDDPDTYGYQHIQNENERVTDVTWQLSKCAKYTRWAISGIILVFIIISFVLAFVLNDTIKDAQDAIDDSYTPYATCISDGEDINRTLADALIQCDMIAKNSSQDVKESVAEIRQDLESTQGWIDTYLGEGDQISWKNSGHELDTHRQQLFYVCIGLTSFTLVIVLISIFTSVKINVCTGIVSFLVTVGMLVLWIIASVQFGVSVELADICADPNDAVIQAINHTSFAQSDNTTVPIVKYYVYCNDEYPNNPLISYVSNAYQIILGLNDSLSELQAYAQSEDSSVVENVDALKRDWNESLYETVALNASLNCDNIYGYYKRIENDMCYDLLEEWYALYVMQFIIVGFLVLRLCFTCRNSVNQRVANYIVTRNMSPYKEYYDNDPMGKKRNDDLDRFAL